MTTSQPIEEDTKLVDPEYLYDNKIKENEDEQIFIYKLSFTNLSAKELPKMDEDGKSDPYCSISVCGISKKTEAQKDKLNAEWSEELVYYVLNPPKTIEITVYDDDFKSAPELIGVCKVNVPTFKTGDPRTEETFNEKLKLRVHRLQEQINNHPKAIKAMESIDEMRGTIAGSISIHRANITMINHSYNKGYGVYRPNTDEDLYEEVITKQHDGINDLLRGHVDFVYNNINELHNIAMKINKASYSWSKNDFNTIDAPSQKIQSDYQRYYSQYVDYATNNKYKMLCFDMDTNKRYIFEMKIEDYKAFGITPSNNIPKGVTEAVNGDTEFTEITDAIWVMFRQYFLLNILMHGQEDEFNIFRSYYFSDIGELDEATEFCCKTSSCYDKGGCCDMTEGCCDKARCCGKSNIFCNSIIFGASDSVKKLSLSLVALSLQVILTGGIVYQVVHDWDIDVSFDEPSERIIICISALIFVFLAFTTDSTIRKCFKFYENISALCVIPWYCIIGDYISNVLVPITICCVSFFFLSHSEHLGDLVLNSFALTFVIELDDDVNVFESDEDFILKNDINLFLEEKKEHDNNKSSFKKRIIHLDCRGFLHLVFSPAFILLNIYHSFMFFCFIVRGGHREKGIYCGRCSCTSKPTKQKHGYGLARTDEEDD